MPFHQLLRQSMRQQIRHQRPHLGCPLSGCDPIAFCRPPADCPTLIGSANNSKHLAKIVLRFRRGLESTCPCALIRLGGNTAPRIGTYIGELIITCQLVRFNLSTQPKQNTRYVHLWKRFFFWGCENHPDPESVIFSSRKSFFIFSLIIN